MNTHRIAALALMSLAFATEGGWVGAAYAARCACQPCLAGDTSIVVITDQDAALPDAARTVTLGGRGLIPPPAIAQISPAPGSSSVGQHFALKIGFTPAKGSPIDVNSVKLTYLKNPEVDLTASVRPYITADGISIPEVRFPPGSHRIRVEVADTHQHVGRAVFEVSVRPN